MEETYPTISEQLNQSGFSAPEITHYHETMLT